MLRAKMELFKRKLEAFDPNLAAAFWRRVEAVERDPAPYLTL